MAKVNPKAKAGRTKETPEATHTPPDEANTSKDLPRKRAFARRYIETGQATVAYIDAGYTGQADKKAYALLNDPFIRSEIERLYRDMELDTLVTTRYVISNIRRAADITGQVKYSPTTGTLDMLDVGAHLRANQMLGQFLGIFREKIDVGDNLAALLGKLPDPTPGK